MLIIHGRAITDVDDPALIDAFGRSYERGEPLGSTIDWYLENQQGFYFPSMEAIAAKLVGVDENAHLIIQNTHPNVPNAVPIRMTGNRTADFAAANLRAGLEDTPENYTWHHAERIRQVGRHQYDCDMYLLQTSYHSAISHVGGVYEYEQYTGEEYG